MERLFASENIQIDLDGQNSLIIARMVTPDYITENELFESLKFLSRYVEQYKPKRVLIDTKEVFFPITSEVSNWITSNITPKFLENHVEKVAYVLPNDVLSRTGVEQFIEELFGKVKEISRMIFDDTQKAMDWLLKD